MPFCPFWPAFMGCLTLVISVTRSAASISLGSLRPAITTCWWPGRAASTLTTSSTSTQPHFIG